MFEFSQLGLVYMRSLTTSRFYPTRAAINMLFKGTSSNDDLVAGSVSGSTSSIEAFASRTSSLEIIVETNMQVVAYCESDLHLAMLKLFVEVETRMPNMAMGKVGAPPAISSSFLLHYITSYDTQSTQCDKHRMR